MTTLSAAADDPQGTIPINLLDGEPNQPFGVLRLPDQHKPVTEYGVRMAYAALLAHYKVAASKAERDGEQSSIGDQLDKALALALDKTRWTIHEKYVAIVGSNGDTYKTNVEFCEGPSWVARGRRSNACRGSIRAKVGMCQHQLAVEILRLAQERDPMIAAQTDADEPLPSPETLITQTTMPGFALLATLGAISIVQRKLAAEEVVLLFDAENGLFTASRDQYSATAPAAPSAGAYVSLTPAAFAELWGEIREKAPNSAEIVISVTIDHDDNGAAFLNATGAGIDISVSAQAMPL